MPGRTFPKKIVLLAVSAVLLGAGVVASANKAAQTAAPQEKAVERAATTLPAGSAGWIYREPGSPMPRPLVTRDAIVPRVQAAKDPKNGVSMTLPPMTASVATIDARGHVDYDCENEAGSKARVAGKPGHRD